MKSIAQQDLMSKKGLVSGMMGEFTDELAKMKCEIAEVADLYGNINAKLEVFLKTQAYDSDDGDINERLEGFLNGLNVDEDDDDVVDYSPPVNGKTKKKKKKRRDKLGTIAEVMDDILIS